MTSKVLGDKLVLFRFENESDKKRVTQGACWAFDNKLVVISEFDGDVQPSKLRVNTSSMDEKLFHNRGGGKASAQGGRRDRDRGNIQISNRQQDKDKESVQRREKWALDF
ncbi:hypothetical protein ACH5RR_015878 [Cinchona calisaya]|uniref:DUF4283 domain-containing protein n=1 Tax=Cinchona calisaya TaxID=153742 RepID=A0ABD2ZUE5_9GENT